MIVLGAIINRLASVPYPLWAPIKKPT